MMRTVRYRDPGAFTHTFPSQRRMRRRPLVTTGFLRMSEDSPRSERYDCGFDPNNCWLRTVTNHWRACRNAQCCESLSNYEAFKARLNFLYA